MKLPATDIRKIAIFRALQLGDCLCAIPAVRALRAAYPTAEITLLGLPWAKNFVSRFSQYFDRFMHFPGYNGLPEQPFESAVYNSFVREINQEHFDLLIQLQGNGTIVNDIMQDWGAARFAGFYPQGFKTDDPLLMEYPNEGPEPERHVRLMEYLGLQSQGLHLKYPILKDDEDVFDLLALPYAPHRYVCVHPGSRGAWRQWPVEHFAALADYCAENGYGVVLTGVSDEAGITKAVKESMRNKALDLTGKTTMGSIALVIKNARLLISNCTGVSHIASAMATPSIVISMDGEPERWGPVNRHLHKVTDWTTQPDYELVLNNLKEQLQQSD